MTVQALDLQPEDSIMGSQASSDDLRDGLDRLLVPLLKLATVSLYKSPQGRQLSESAASFVETHHKTLLRILREVNDINSRSEPSRVHLTSMAATGLRDVPPSKANTTDVTCETLMCCTRW